MVRYSSSEGVLRGMESREIPGERKQLAERPRVDFGEAPSPATDAAAGNKRSSGMFASMRQISASKRDFMDRLKTLQFSVRNMTTGVKHLNGILGREGKGSFCHLLSA